MDTRDLRYFIAAAETGHLHQAAIRVGRSQPALSKCIRRLETELGARLFEPAGRGIRLTAMGQALLVRARLLVQGEEDARRAISDLAEGAAGHIRLGTGPTAAEWLLPGLLRRVLDQSPRLSFSVTTGLGVVLRQALREARLDLAITPLLETDPSEFATFAVAGDTMVVAGRAGHPLDRAGLTIADLAPFGWLLPPPTLSSTGWLLRALQVSGLGRPRVRVEVDTVTMLRRVVAQTDLLTFLSRRDLGPALSELALPAFTLRRQLGVLAPRDQTVSPAAGRIIGLLEEEGREFEALPAF